MTPSAVVALIVLANEENDKGVEEAWHLPSGIFIGMFFASGGCT
jgi:hypothetical protein